MKWLQNMFEYKFRTRRTPGHILTGATTLMNPRSLPMEMQTSHWMKFISPEFIRTKPPQRNRHPEYGIFFPFTEQLDMNPNKTARENALQKQVGFSGAVGFTGYIGNAGFAGFNG